MLKYLLTFLALSTVEISAKLGKTVELNDGNLMPTVAFGTFVKADEVNATEQATLDAIKCGFKHIDTSLLYLTEPAVGSAINTAISNGIVKREEMFVTSKMDLGYTREMVFTSINQSLTNLGLEYLDLYLVHLSYNPIKDQDFDVVNIWKGMEEVQSMGLARSIGVANFNSTHIIKLLTETDVIPAVNQIETHPAYANLELVAYCQSKGITVMGYAPHGHLVPRPHLHYTSPPAFNDTVLVDIANKYGKSTNQVVLRYLMDRDIVPIPKSYTKEHTIDNFDVHDFSLTECEVNKISEFNKNAKVYDLNSISGINDFLQYYYNQTLEEAFSTLLIE